MKCALSGTERRGACVPPIRSAPRLGVVVENDKRGGQERAQQEIHHRRDNVGRDHKRVRSFCLGERLHERHGLLGIFDPAQPDERERKLHADQTSSKRTSHKGGDGRAAIKRAIERGASGAQRASSLLSRIASSAPFLAERRGLFPEKKVNEEPGVHVNHEGADQQIKEQS